MKKLRFEKSKYSDVINIDYEGRTIGSIVETDTAFKLKLMLGPEIMKSPNLIYFTNSKEKCSKMCEVLVEHGFFD